MRITETQRKIIEGYIAWKDIGTFRHQQRVFVTVTWIAFPKIDRWTSEAPIVI